jgi:hypothetical protein
MPKGKRRDPDSKLADEIKKKIGYRNKPQTCSACAQSEEDPSSDNPGGLCCNIYQGLVVFPVDPGANCDMFKKKRKPRKQNEETTEGSEAAPKKSSKKKKKKKKK